MEVHHVHVQPGEDRHGPIHSVGDVVELQVQENLVSPGFDFPDDGGPFGVVQLHADFHKGLVLPGGEAVQEPQGLFPRGEIQGNNYILSHDGLLLSNLKCGPRPGARTRRAGSR